MTTTLPTPIARSLPAIALLLGACSTVDLGPRYDPPPVRSPEAPRPSPPVAAPAPATIAQPSPVPPTQPVAQPLPPVGTPQPPTSAVPVAPETNPADPRAHLVTFTTRLTGADAVPPTRSSGSGQIDALYDANTGLLRWRASWSGLSSAITGVNFHGPASEGQTAPVTLVWPAPFGPTYEGHATLPPQQAQDLLSGRWYISIQTSLYPGGEVRGQLRVVH